MQQVVANACKQKAAADMFERPSKVMCREMSRAALGVLTEDDQCSNTEIYPQLVRQWKNMNEAL